MESAEEFYGRLPKDFFYKANSSLNPVSRWYHNHRCGIMRSWVGEFYKKESRILDVGCGSCNWNSDKLPVFGVDVNEKLMEFGKRHGNLCDYAVLDFEKEELPEGKFDIAVCSEVLEHVKEPQKVLGKIVKALKTDGILMITVPYSAPDSFWDPLFAMQCFLKGDLLGSELYKRKCGHVNRFSEKSLCLLISSAGFSAVILKVSMKMNIAILAKKKSNDFKPQK